MLIELSVFIVTACDGYILRTAVLNNEVIFKDYKEEVMPRSILTFGWQKLVYHKKYDWSKDYQRHWYQTS
jgi:hypothetical protein